MAGVLNKPDALNLSGNMNQFLLSSTGLISFILKKGNQTLLEQSYEPGPDLMVRIDLKEVIEGQLSYNLDAGSLFYVQPNLAETFTAVIDGTEYNFRVVRGGVANLADTASNWLKLHFLTWQPRVKPVTYYSPEWLTYYAVEECTAKLKATYPDKSTKVISLGTCVAGHVTTMNLQYSVIAGKLGNTYPSYYEVWIERSGTKLSESQVYAFSDPISDDEQWYLFENSLGGLDTFRATGTNSLNAEHEHNIAEFGDVREEYQVDTQRKYTKNTGYLDEYSRRWLLDFFPSRAKYVYEATAIRKIVVTESNATYVSNELPSSYTFTWQLAEISTYLNLVKNENDIPDNLVAPDLSSPDFILPPRLAEFPRVQLTEGVLIPAFDPNNPKPTVTTYGEIRNTIKNAIVKELEEDIGNIGGGSSSELEIVESKEPTSKATDKNVFSALAALAHFLRKDAPDVAEKLLKFLEGAEFGIFESGMITGKGGKIWPNGHAELMSLLLRGWLEVPEMRYNRVLVVGGELWVTDGAKFDTITQIGDLFNVKLKLEEGELVTFWVGDILKGIYHDKSTDGKFKGFRTLWFRVIAVDQTEQTIKIASRYPDDSKYNPVQFLEVARIGSFTETSRQRSILIDSKENCITFLDHVNTWDITPNMEVCWLGRKDRTIPGVPSTAGYNAKLSNIIMSGKIFQYDEITGTDYLVPIDKGTYVDGQRYAYYDRVSAPGGLWLCVNEAGTTQRPNKGSSDWLLQVADGSTPEPAGTWNDYTNYVKNNIVTLDGDSYIALRDNINERPKKNYGGYLTTGGKYLTTGGKRLYTGDINPAWMLLAEKGLDGSDGVNGKDGESILWKGELPSHPANPQNGWSYRNTTDGKSYVYQDGSWYLMTIDGIDGKNGKDGISITWKGDLSTPPSEPELNWVYRDTDNGKVYIWNGNAWALMVVDGTDGADGADGKDGFSVFITYNDQLSEPAIPTGDGTTGGWHTNTSPAVIWMSQKVAASATEGTWGKPIKIKGEKGINFITENYSPYKEYKVGDVVPFNGGKIYCKKDNTGQTPVPILSTGGKLLKTGNFYLLYKPLAVNTINSEYWEIFVDKPVKEEIEQTFTAYFVGSPNVTPPTPILTGNTLGWSTTVPATFNWVSQKRAISIAGGSWSKPVRMTAEDGKDGINATTRWLTSNTPVIHFNSFGSPTPSSVLVSCKKQVGILPVEPCSDLYLTYKIYANTTFVFQSTPQKVSSVTISNIRVDGIYYVRGYEKLSDAQAWNNNFTTEYTITHVEDGKQGERGPTSSAPRSRGPFVQGQTYVWDEQWRDHVFYAFEGVNISFMVKNYGTSVKTPPSSPDGDNNWVSAQVWDYTATNTALIEGADIAGFIFKNKKMQSRDADSDSGEPYLLLDGKTGEFIGNKCTLRGKFETSKGGNRIIIDPVEKCLKMINSDNKEITRLDFFVTSTRSGPRLAFDLYNSGIKKANLVITGDGLSIYDDYIYAPFFAVDATNKRIKINADRMPLGRDKVGFNEVYLDGETLKVKKG